MIKYKLHATIGLPDYSNLQPEIELEGDNIEELHATAMEHIGGLWAKYGKTPLPSSTGQIEGNKTMLEELKSFTDETILWDEINHKYFDKDGNVLMSGSAYADKVSPKFDKGAILPKTAKAWGVSETALDDMWKLQGDISNEYGSAVHSALDIWHKYAPTGKAIQDKKQMDSNYALPKNEHIKNIVLSFEEQFGSDAMTEVLITDVAHKMAGRIDRLQVLDHEAKVCRVGDYKTNNDLDAKKLLKYQNQLSFYAHILINKGWTVKGLDIFHYDGVAWNKIEQDVLELSS